ncbi:MAG: VWA domain-containing protein, partial [Anaerolineae bacterium]|nr:VWA domain-containing protein [Anaerolineae bacterium]
IIIDPPIVPPPPEWSPWLTIRYHRVMVAIEDQVAITRVDQVFRNDSPTEAEGVYIFPLPPGAVVDDFTMWVDGTPLESKILPADEARAIYEDYVRRRQDPALLEYIGREAIQARIFPIPPGEERRIELEYTQVLEIENGLMHYRYPLNTERFSAYPLEQVSISVEIASKTPIHTLYSSTHQDEILIMREGHYAATVSYEAHHILPERDFELYTGFGEETIAANLLSYAPEGEAGYFLLMVSPNLFQEQSAVLPKDLFIVLDTSGSMDGEKLTQAKEALDFILENLNSEDRFNIIAFSSTIRAYARGPQAATEIAAAKNWISDLEAIGGTNIYLALSEALAQAASERNTVIIFLTDGLPTEGITEEDTLLSALQQETPEAVRIFPFGVGYDVNTLLLDQLAENHRGRPTYVEPDERLDEIVSAFYARIQSPLLTDIALDFGAVEVYDTYPQPLPDLYAGAQLIVAGRYTGRGAQAITLTGNMGNQQKTFRYEGAFAAAEGEDFIPRLWAARKIGFLLTQIRLHGENQEWVEAVVALSLRYGIITQYTSFLVEEEALTTEGREWAADELLAVPTPAPSGEDAIQEAKSREALEGAQAPPPAMEAPLGFKEENGGAPGMTFKYAGDKTFMCSASTCTDTAFIPDQMAPLTVRFDSETYWQKLAANPNWLPYLALAPEVTFVTADGTAYHVQPGANVVEDPLPEPDDKDTSVTAPTQEVQPGNSIEPQGPENTPKVSVSQSPNACAAPLALAALALLLVLVLRR